MGDSIFSEEIYEAIEAWVTDHTKFGSKRAIEDMMERIRDASTYNSVFRTAVQDKMLDMKNAFLFMHFIDYSIRQLYADNEVGDPDKFDFDLVPAQETIMMVYDIDAKEHFGSYIEDDSDDEEDED